MTEARLHAAPTRRAVLAAGATALAAPAFAQAAWPAGPVRYVCIFPTGWSTD